MTELGGNWEMKRKIRTYSGTLSNEVTNREIRNRRIARKAAADGMVLMKNENHLLPLKEGQKIALLGGGAVRTIKGGTGSGDVNERESVSILKGMENAGFLVTTKQWLEDYDKEYHQARLEWRDLILSQAKELDPVQFFNVYSSHPFAVPAGRKIREDDVDKETDTAVYVISRVAGEGADRRAVAGDYCLTDEELENLDMVCRSFGHVVLVLNTGSQMDLSILEKYASIESVIYMAQAGMEGGNALADIISGKVTPSGKLTDTWAVQYEDFPASAFFSHNDGDVDIELYEEGIYVGYRYFDAFGIRPLYAFGHGLSYTEFSLCPAENVIIADEAGQKIHVKMQVKNTGAAFSGKEVVQIYASCPQSGLEKEHKRLVGFAKTELLSPGRTQEVEMTFPVKALASFDQEQQAWVAEAGLYGIWAGNASDHISLLGAVEITETAVIERTKEICPLQNELKEISRPVGLAKDYEEKWQAELLAKQLPVVKLTAAEGKLPVYPESEAEKIAEELVDGLDQELLIPMVIGEISKGQSAEGALGAAGIMVPGAAGETGSALDEKYGIPGLSMADGPAGLRLKQSYEVSREDGSVYATGLASALEGGFFAEPESHENVDVYYQYCTAIPVGILLAQTWDPALIRETGRAVGEEMLEMGVTWWLAPGMNIHRDPLCGRNFEYYSEDPVVSGVIGAAITDGVQSWGGIGTTIKHFACNNQEENRKGTDSILSQRALREIYLRGFEIAVKTAQPMAVMTSYNMINGVHSANNYDICTQALRNEWGFKGIVMTDWTTTDADGGSIPWKCVSAGNDLIMPGTRQDLENIREALEDGSLSTEELKACVKRIVSLAYQSNCFEDAVPYSAQFQGCSGK